MLAESRSEPPEIAPVLYFVSAAGVYRVRGQDAAGSSRLPVVSASTKVPPRMRVPEIRR